MLIDEITKSGFAKVDCKTEWPDLWAQLEPLARAWADGPNVTFQIESYQEDPKQYGNKLFLARRMPNDKTLDYYFSGDPWLMAIPQIGSVAKDYFGVMPELAYFDLWYTIPLPYERTRVSSQTWHKDEEGQNQQGALLKAFLYFDDITELSDGMMEIESIDNGPQSIPMKTGEIVFADTGRCTHRGGYCIDKSRLLALWYFYNPTKIRIFPRYDMSLDLKNDLGEWGETLWGYQAATDMFKELAAAGVKPNIKDTLK